MAIHLSHERHVINMLISEQTHLSGTYSIQLAYIKFTFNADFTLLLYK